MKTLVKQLLILAVACPAWAGTLDQPAFDTQVRGGKITSEYSKNPIAADAKLKGKTYVVSGSITEIAGGADPHLIISETQDVKIWGIRCNFTDAAQLAALKKGQTIRITGTVEGLSRYYVVLSNCALRK